MRGPDTIDLTLTEPDAEQRRLHDQLRAAEAKLAAVRFLIGVANPCDAGRMAVLLSDIDLTVGTGSGRHDTYRRLTPSVEVYRWAARAAVKADIAAGLLECADEAEMSRLVEQRSGLPSHMAAVTAVWVEAAAYDCHHHNR